MSYEKRIQSTDLDVGLRKILGWDEKIFCWGANGKDDEFKIYVNFPFSRTGGYCPYIHIGKEDFAFILRAAGVIKENEIVTAIWGETPMAEHLHLIRIEVL